jgi:hypothetical protein
MHKDFFILNSVDKIYSDGAMPINYLFGIPLAQKKNGLQAVKLTGHSN